MRKTLFGQPRGLVASLESEDLTAPLQDIQKVHPEAIAALGDGAEAESNTQVLDMVTGLQELEVAVDSVSVAAVAVESLTRLKIKLEEMAENGEALSTSGAEFMQIAADQAVDSVGMDPEEERRDMPALESFGSVSGRRSSMEDASESLGSKIARVAKAAWEKFKAFLSKVSAWFKTRTTTGWGIEKRAAKLVEVLKAMDGNTALPEIKNAGAFSYLQKGGKVDLQAAVTKSLENMETAGSAYTLSNGALLSMMDGNREIDFGKIYSHYSEVKSGEGSSLVWDGLYGGKVARIELPSTKVSIDSIGSVKYSVDTEDQHEGDTIPSIKVGDALVLVEKLSKYLNDLTSGTMSKVYARFEDLEKKGEQLSAKADSDSDKSKAGYAVTLFSAMMRDINHFAHISTECSRALVMAVAAIEQMIREQAKASKAAA